MKKNKIQNVLCIAALYVLIATAACVENTAIEKIDQPCFTLEALETVPWIVDELKLIQDPRMGYNAAVYLYNDQQYLAITHPFDCSPLGHVFNCAGVPLDSLNIDYRDFSENRRLVAVLAKIKL